MMPDVVVWDAMASALEYPREQTAAICSAAARSVEIASFDALATALGRLADYLTDAPAGEPEERYTVLFDLKPVCCLYVGWHIFADTYARGALLAGLARELNGAGVSHRHDLPDFLPTLLRLAPRMADDEDRAVLVHGVVLRGLEKIEAGLKEASGPWVEVVLALRQWLTAVTPRGELDIPVLHRPLEVLSC